MKTYLSCLAAALLAAPGPALAADAALPDGLYAEFTTPRGAFVCELFADRTPLTVTNFVALAEGTHPAAPGQPYYANLRWYRVVPGFVLQSGNPKAPAEEELGYAFPDELVPGLRHDAAGVLSMANGGPDTNANEFFVTLADTTRLNYLHSVFGRVVRGLEVLPAIQPDDALAVRILRVGEQARAFRADAEAFRSRAAAAPRYAGTPEPSAAAHFDDPDRVLPADPPRAKNFNFKLANFERATGRKIIARVFARSPAPAEDTGPGEYMRALAGRLGVARTGILAVYFADESDWRVWVGDERVADFLGRPVSSADLGEGGAVHDAKDVLFAEVDARAARYADQARAARGPANPLTAADLAKYSVDAMLDLLIFRFEPKR
ncbi:MAG TPA: peptidylprolyl isomerase [Opitutaceae bacterium]|nr:peptidylprolyl isomerase [Opitutaceae bacterium]